MNDKCIYHSMINNKGDISMPVVISEPKNLNDVSFKQRAIDLIAKEQEELEELKRQKKSPFARFYQVNKDNSEYLRSCLKENPKALQVLFFIFDHMDKYNAVVCSYKVFQDALDMGQATVARSIKYLKEHGFYMSTKQAPVMSMLPIKTLYGILGETIGNTASFQPI